MKHFPIVLLSASAFLAPLMGGQVYIGAQAFDGSLRGPSLPFLAHALLGILVLLALISLVATRRVVPLASPYVALPLIAMVFSFGMACGISSFKWLSWIHWLEWVSYAFALAATVAIVGRDRGPRILMWAIVAGCVGSAIEGILEYASVRSVDPSWRIFASWVNPNALAGMLVIGFVVALSMVASEEDRLAKFLAGSASIVVGFGLLLTQSKGSYVALLVGLVVLVSLQFFFGARRSLYPMIIPALVLGLLVVGLRNNPSTSAGLGRVEAAQGTSEQSAGFRQLLWKGAISAVRENPFGYGLGTYRYESARAGLTPQTQFAHQGWLQIAVETGVLGLVCWISLAAGWFWTVLRGARRAPIDRSIRLAGIVAAVVACATHNLMDSDWQHFGIGLTFFFLLGIGLQLGADGSLPEMLPKPARTLGVLIPAGLSLALLHSGLVEFMKANGLSLLERQELAAPRELNAARGLAPGDGEIEFLLAYADPAQRLAHLERAAALTPTTKNLRALAIELKNEGDLSGAESALQRALRSDPNNLPSLLLLTKWSDEPTKWAKRLIAVEQTPYFMVRALPQLIPTEIAEAKLILADVNHDDDLRLSALRTFAEYARVTVPQIQAQVRAGGSDYAGETPLEAMEKLRGALAVARDLLRRAQSQGKDVTELERLANAFSPPSFAK